MTFQVKRIYDPADAADRYRVLVDRLWPRGVSKKRAQLDEWAKEVAPSTELRTWFDHRADRFDDFVAKYRTELNDNPLVASLRKRGADGMVTLLYSAHDPELNQAVVLRGVLEG